MTRYNCWMNNRLKNECQFIDELLDRDETKNLQPVEIGHAHLSVSNRSYLSASPHTLVRQILQIES